MCYAAIGYVQYSPVKHQMCLFINSRDVINLVRGLCQSQMCCNFLFESPCVGTLDVLLENTGHIQLCDDVIRLQGLSVIKGTLHRTLVGVSDKGQHTCGCQ